MIIDFYKNNTKPNIAVLLSSFHQKEEKKCFTYSKRSKKLPVTHCKRNLGAGLNGVTPYTKKNTAT